jgi:hypothetical protein
VRRINNGSDQITICPDFKNFPSEDHAHRSRRKNYSRWQIQPSHAVTTVALMFEKHGLSLLDIALWQAKSDR